jgi:non-heme chloroperoxidase
MSFVSTKDGTRIYYREYGEGQPFVFSHGWPLNADAWDGQMLFLANNGFRVIAHDRRGHGRSDQPSKNNDMDTYADDLAAVIEALDLKDAILVGHSTGGGEVARYIGRHGTGRVARVVLVGAVTPVMKVGPNNPDGVPQDVFDGIRKAVLDNRSASTCPSRTPSTAGTSAIRRTRACVSPSGSRACRAAHAQYECVQQFSETDFTEDLKKIDVPTLIVHGDSDHVVPIDITARKAVTIVPNATLAIYEGGTHAIPTINQDKFTADLLAFARS